MLKYASPCAKGEGNKTKQNKKVKAMERNGSRGGRGVVAASHLPSWELSFLLHLLSGSGAALLAFHLPC